MITITREFGIDYGHRLVNHESKCRHVHGHRGRILVTLTAPQLDTVGRVLDFSVVKAVIGDWFDSMMDHAFIAEEGDPIIEWLTANQMRVMVMPNPPTAENLAALSAKSLQAKLARHGCKLVCLDWFETPNCRATWVADTVETGAP